MTEDQATSIAIARVEGAADPKWKEAALESAKMVCMQKEEFTVDDIWDVFKATYGNDMAEYGTHELRAMGALVRRAASKGFCERTGSYILSDRDGCHRGARNVWKSKIVGGAA